MAKKCSTHSGHRRFKVQTNPQGWLPPTALTGCGGRDIGSHTSLILYVLTAAGSEQTQLPFRTPDRRIPIHPQGSTKAPASPHTTRAGGANRDWHLGRVEARGAAGEPKKGWGLFVIIWFTAKGAKTAKNPTARALGSLWRSIFIKIIF
ncbi:MAG: hypothetical protein C5S44_12055 [Candidatus Methanocomedens sp.]|nr:MAG: hypothetical protein C5S44_12055 [ANME-2 cluster archaeon]